MVVGKTKGRGRPVDPDLAARRGSQILDTAAKIFAQRGYAGTDIQVVADAVGVGKGTIYRYFPSKEKLFLAAADRGMRCIRESVDAAIAPVEDPLARIAAAISAYLQFFDERPEFAELVIQERAVFKGRRKPTYFEHREANLARWRQLYVDLIADGRVRDLPVEAITSAISNLAYGTMFTNFFAGRVKPPAEQANEIVDIVLNGLLSDKERRRRATAPEAESP
ncbi:MAG: TetR/AcrR family transcriptional regulator [Phycisphaerae bacterium]|nr:TetR/AcrR family transcriptional regulator [Phycisphaerae bacterium]